VLAGIALPTYQARSRNRRADAVSRCRACRRAKNLPTNNGGYTDFFALRSRLAAPKAVHADGRSERCRRLPRQRDSVAGSTQDGDAECRVVLDVRAALRQTAERPLLER